MAFNSWRSFSDFASKTCHETRYIYTTETVQFIDEVLLSSKSREKLLKKGSRLWRAQIGNELETFYDEDGNEIGESEFPYQQKRMYPLSCAAKEGRANPKGIPCLYLATDYNTAVSECRPWVGINLSVGEFITTRDLKIIDCSTQTEERQIYYDLDDGFYEPNERDREIAVWSDINHAFSIPVNNNDSQASYAPTQIIAEAFKYHGYQGLTYKSSVGKGCNVVLFSNENAAITKRYIFKLEDITFKFKQIK